MQRLCGSIYAQNAPMSREISWDVHIVEIKECARENEHTV